MVTERADVEPRRTAAVRADLPVGATVADLVAALTARRCPLAPAAAIPAQRQPVGLRPDRPVCPAPDRQRPPTPDQRHRGAAGPPVRPDHTRPPIGDDLSLFGLSRRSRSRLGSRVFALSFALVFGLIFVQMIFSILYP